MRCVVSDRDAARATRLSAGVSGRPGVEHCANRLAQLGALGCLAAVVLALNPAICRSEDWDELPCVAKVAVVAPGEAGFTNEELSALASRVAAGLEQANGGCCAAVASEPAPALSWRVARGLQHSRWSELASASLDKGSDKLVLVVVRRAPSGWRIEAQEWDRYAGLGPLGIAVAARRAAILPAARQLVVEVVQPIARVTMLSPTEAVIRLRGGRRPVPEAAAVAAPGVLFRLCRRDQTGGSASQGVRAVGLAPPEVLLRVEEYAEGTARCSVLRAQPHAAFLEGTYYAARMAPLAAQTVLRFSNAEGKPLAAFEVFVQASAGPYQPAGTTGEDGSIDLTRHLGPWCWVELRHGQVVLARLPIVPGWQEAADWRLPIGDAQLEALAILEGLEVELEEGVVRRAMLLARGQQAVASGRFEEAERALQELRAQPLAIAFKRKIDEQLRTISAADPAWQDALRRMFAELSQAADRHLSAAAVDALTEALDRARNPPPVEPASQGEQPANNADQPTPAEQPAASAQ